MQKQSVSPGWDREKLRGYAFQFLTFAAVSLFIYYLYSNTQENLAQQNIASGFGFLSQEAGFEIAESLIDYNSYDTYLKALVVGLLSTLKVALVGNILAIALGIFVGICSRSTNWLVAKISRTYIEVIRNIPLILQLFFWYAIFTDILPSVRESTPFLPYTFLTNRGLYYPKFDEHFIWPYVWGALFISFIGCYFIRKMAMKKMERDAVEVKVLRWCVALVVALPVLTWLVGGAPLKLTLPELAGFNFSGGGVLTPEFASLLLGLVLYTGAFNAEIVRSGIESVSKGQWEAAKALGLSQGQTLNLVILPQSLRVVIPPLTSQILNLTKNSSLAVAIGYSDFVAVANTTMNQTGQAIEAVALIMLVYLFFSLTTSLFMNWYNKKVALVER